VHGRVDPAHRRRIVDERRRLAGRSAGGGQLPLDALRAERARGEAPAQVRLGQDRQRRPRFPERVDVVEPRRVTPLRQRVGARREVAQLIAQARRQQPPPLVGRAPAEIVDRGGDRTSYCRS